MKLGHASGMWIGKAFLLCKPMTQNGKEKNRGELEHGVQLSQKGMWERLAKQIFLIITNVTRTGVYWNLL